MDAGSPPCAAPHDLCDDFSGTTFPDPSRWTTLDRVGTATITRTTTDFVSAPASLEATATGQSSTTAMLVKSLTGTIKGLVCEMSVKATPQVGDPNVFFNFVLDVQPTASAPVESWFVVFGTVLHTLTEFWTIRNGAADGKGFDPPPPLPNAWVRVRIVLTAGPPSTITLSYDGAKVGDITLLHFPLQHDGVELKFGAQTDPDKPGGTVRIDDVVCDMSR
jgi:hypothetical protein